MRPELTPPITQQTVTSIGRKASILIQRPKEVNLLLQGADVNALVALEALWRVLERSHTRLAGRLVLDPVEQTWAMADGQTGPSIFQSKVLTRALHQVIFGCMPSHETSHQHQVPTGTHDAKDRHGISRRLMCENGTSWHSSRWLMPAELF